MAINWRPATGADLKTGLLIQPRARGDALIGLEPALDVWRRLVDSAFFASAVLESNPAIQGHQLIGFGASVVVSPSVSDAELAAPQPDMTSRLIARIQLGESVLATRRDVAAANAGEGIDIVVLFGYWRDEILTPAERQSVQTLLASSFVQWHVGYKIRRIFSESADEPARKFAQGSIVYRPIAEFPELGRVIHLMTPESALSVQAHLGNILFGFSEPVLRLRPSDQDLLLAAMNGATDRELAVTLGATLSAVKARWRSILGRLAQVMPDEMNATGDPGARGEQKRHRVLEYIGSHPEELRPYDWNEKGIISLPRSTCGAGTASLNLTPCSISSRSSQRS